MMTIAEKRKIVWLVGIGLALMLLLTMPATRSYSRDVMPAIDDALLLPAAAVGDRCAEFLQQTRDDPLRQKPQAVHPVAGQAAAISLIFGVRYALGPREQAQTQTTGHDNSAVATTDGQKAIAVAQYRRCRNAEMLAVM